MDMTKLLEAVKARKGEIEARKTSGVKIAKIPPGITRWRILPGWRPAETHVYFHDFGQHWFKNAAGTVVAVVVCDWDTFATPCPFDAPIRDAIRATTDDKTVERLKEFLSKRNVLVNAVQIQGPQADPNKAVLLGLPQTVADAYASLLHSRLSDDINMLDLETGRDILIEKLGSGMQTRYNTTDAAKSTPINPVVMTTLTNIDAWIANERTRGQAKATEGLNAAMAGALGVAAPGASASLVSTTAPAAALAAPATVAPAVVASAAPAVAAAATVLAETPEPARATVATPAAVATAAAGFDEAVNDDELAGLLAAIDAT
jgi:hypothetical protein